jgi:hypothetical protein
MCRFIFLVLAVMAMGLTSARANLIANPGFETCSSGQAPGWQPSTINPLGFPCSPPSHTGIFAAHMTGAGSLAQTIVTVPGQSYEFTFWLAGSGGLNPSNNFFANFGSTRVLTLSNTTLPSYTLEEFTVTATLTTEQIIFDGFNSTGIWSLDDVSLTAIPSVPEPASLTLLGGLLVGFWCMRRRSRTRLPGQTFSQV